MAEEKSPEELAQMEAEELQKMKEIDDLKEAHPREYALFQQMDKDNSGFLDPYEIRDWCARMGEEVLGDKLFESMDADGNGMIELSEFISGFQKVMPIQFRKVVYLVIHGVLKESTEENDLAPKMEEYKLSYGSSLRNCGAQVLTSGPPTVLQGETCFSAGGDPKADPPVPPTQSNLCEVLMFNDKESCEAWWSSDEYTALAKAREELFTSSFTYGETESPLPEIREGDKYMVMHAAMKNPVKLQDYTQGYAKLLKAKGGSIMGKSRTATAFLGEVPVGKLMTVWRFPSTVTPEVINEIMESKEYKKFDKARGQAGSFTDIWI